MVGRLPGGRLTLRGVTDDPEGRLVDHYLKLLDQINLVLLDEAVFED